MKQTRELAGGADRLQKINGSECDITIKMDSDDKWIRFIPMLIKPLIEDKADFTKGIVSGILRP
jgi:hypothetical protein